MTKQLVNNVVQIGVIVHDVDLAVSKYRDILGLQPWSINHVDTRNGIGRKFKKDGVDIEIKAKIAWIQLGNVEIELIQPLDEDNVYYEHLTTKGPGLHHIMFEAVDYDQCDADLQQQGYRAIGEGELQKTRFKLFDMVEDLGLICEIAEGEPLIPDA